MGSPACSPVPAYRAHAIIFPQANVLKFWSKLQKRYTYTTLTTTCQPANPPTDSNKNNSPIKIKFRRRHRLFPIRQSHRRINDHGRIEPPDLQRREPATEVSAGFRTRWCFVALRPQASGSMTAKTDGLLVFPGRPTKLRRLHGTYESATGHHMQ
ncbi:hypothetical protein P691DRAFT_374154 [Macrolepiota fuliginosa MF-IS2]|uniref:Uncharacterized protein n=1 Tax=Macrolepiota fuliginosa MF-IS2 TaxID=1400762 RepID=A0A9P5XJ69_9AGAR|nr:hypothetical protein P691DRAFT_374154 [Macrolepiota fuliginosa MF-IS2]